MSRSIASLVVSFCLLFFSSFAAYAHVSVLAAQQQVSYLAIFVVLIIGIANSLFYWATRNDKLLSSGLFIFTALAYTISMPSGLLANSWLACINPSLLAVAGTFALLFSPVLVFVWTNWLKLSLLLVNSLAALFLFWLPDVLAMVIAVGLAIITCSYIVIAGLLAKAKLTTKLVFSIAWATLLLALILTSTGLVNGQLLPLAALTIFTILIAALAVWLFAEQRSALLDYQHLMIEQAQDAKNQQAELIKQQQAQQEELEAMMQERTFELEVTLRELQEKNVELEEKNTLDPLTGIRNRRFFDKKLLAEYRRSRREQSVLSLIMLDIDHFKSVNDTHGHQAGDDVIRRVAKLTEELLKRPSDSVCRYGGEEFALILPSTDEAGAMAVAEHIRNCIAQKPIHTCEGPLAITVSLGVASVIANKEQTEADLLKSADQALYAAKQTGRNKVCFTGSTVSQSLESE